MANTRELRRRIKSVKNTSQITKAMQMVAATKMRRAQNQATSGRPYAQNLAQSLSRLLPQINIEAHPLLTGNGSKTAGVVLLSTDKGLVGALNTNILRQVSSLHPGGVSANVVYYTVGKKGRAFVVRTGKSLKADFENLDAVSLRLAKQLAKLLIGGFSSVEFGEAYLIYPHFVTTLRQESRKVKLLPISISDIGYRISEKTETDTRLTIDDKQAGEFLFEPDPDTLLDYLLIHHIEEQIYQALLEAKASEHSSRMIAMQNATDNARDLMEDLQLTYNQTRQGAITKELLEITTAQAAMQ